MSARRVTLVGGGLAGLTLGIGLRQRLEAALLMRVRIGDKVKIVGGGRQQGEVLEVRRDKYMVRLGGVLSTWVQRKQFVHWEVDL